MLFSRICFSVCLFSIIKGSLSTYENSKLVIYASKTVSHGKIEENVNGTLVLTCKVLHKNATQPISLIWLLPEHIEPRPGLIKSKGNDSVKLTVSQLHESDSGEYICEGNHTESNFSSQTSVLLRVKQRHCHSSLFKCSSKSCIPQRYVCDGMKDCEDGRDESFSQCGEDACENKIPCDLGRCIPKEWCCILGHPNCTTLVRPACCPPVPQDVYMLHSGITLPNQHYNHMSFLQSTIYTIVGFAMVFMSIVTILMIAICRVQLQRSRSLQSSSVPRRHSHLDMHYNRRNQRSGSEVSSSRLMMPAYAGNTTVELTGELPQPPPYSEVASYDDPPPPYVPIINRDEDSETSPCLCSEKTISPA